MSSDRTEALRERVVDAAEQKSALAITGGGSKAFYGRAIEGEALAIGDHAGVISYEPKELVITARSGTPLVEIEKVLAEQGQRLPFEPPRFSTLATVGGAVATGLSGPARPYAGSVRDYVLGIRLLNGSGEVLRFGGEVMKNVAGYDVSRLVTGSLGMLGMILEVSSKVLPKPETELTLVSECSSATAIESMNRWAAQPLPLSATCHDGKKLWIRLAGSEQAVAAARQEIGGDTAEEGGTFWLDLREQKPAFFREGPAPLWRLSVRSATPPTGLGQEWVDWGGAQRWLRSERSDQEIRRAARQAGGHALKFRGGDREGDVFHPLSAPVAQFHRRLKRAFDPQGLFNPGRMYADL